MKIDVEELLSLSTVPGIGSTRLRALISAFKSPHEVLNAAVVDLIKVEGIDRKIAANIRSWKDDGFAANQLSQLNRHDAHLITYWGGEYPPLLKNIPDPPALLYARGNVLPDDGEAVAVVGTRQGSDYGRLVTEKLCAELAARRITVVSGLARGIDTHAHRSTLEAGGRTIAVLGSGIDVVYPRENRRLAEKIVSAGALLSEYPMGSEPDAPNFPRRNRLIAGMSLGTLVIEAGEKSGALITAIAALEQNREVFAVPGSILSARSYGTNRLIQEGAKLVISVDDIIAELRPQLSDITRMVKAQPARGAVTELEGKILASLTDEPLHIDAIALTHSLPAAHVLSLLLSLELKGLVKQLAGKRFVKV